MKTTRHALITELVQVANPFARILLDAWINKSESQKPVEWKRYLDTPLDPSKVVLLRAQLNAGLEKQITSIQNVEVYGVAHKMHIDFLKKFDECTERILPVPAPEPIPVIEEEKKVIEVAPEPPVVTRINGLTRGSVELHKLKFCFLKLFEEEYNRSKTVKVKNKPRVKETSSPTINGSRKKEHREIIREFERIKTSEPPKISALKPSIFTPTSAILKQKVFRPLVIRKTKKWQVEAARRKFEKMISTAFRTLLPGIVKKRQAEAEAIRTSFIQYMQGLSPAVPEVEYIHPYTEILERAVEEFQKDLFLSLISLRRVINEQVKVILPPPVVTLDIKTKLKIAVIRGNSISLSIPLIREKLRKAGYRLGVFNILL